MSERRFPIMWPDDRHKREMLERRGCPRSVPWAFVEDHAAQARKNHDQSLERLAERGGLSPSELLAVVRGEGLKAVLQRTDWDAAIDLVEMLK